ncbi:MAG: dihydrofolate reductase family protein [Thermoleophilaceae bacterium]
MAVYFDISISLDGFAAGPDQGPDQPLGRRGEELHEWAYDLVSFQQIHGRAAEGERTIDDEVLTEAMGRAGAFVMGRGMFGGGPGSWGDESWEGWWDEDPPFHAPVFVLTHHPREPLVKEGGTTFHFVTDGIESAVEQARAAAGAKDVQVSGGAQAIQQALRAGLIDDGQVHIAPILLGAGRRLFDKLDDADIRLEKTRVIDSPLVTHLAYRVIR